LLTVDEAGIKKEALVIATEMSATAQAAADAAGELAPYYRQMYMQAMSRVVGLRRRLDAGEG